MHFILCLALLLIVTTDVTAETYSWIDDKGTFNFTEDLSTVPKQYLKKVKRFGNMEKDPAAAESVSPEKESAPGDATAVKPVPATAEDKQLYDGKTQAAWRQEFDLQEAELTKLEQHLNMLSKESARQPGPTRERFEVLKKDYDDTKAAYDQKYKVYSELIESARKAGLTVEIKK